MKQFLILFFCLSAWALSAQRIFLGKIIGADKTSMRGIEVSIEGGSPALSDDHGLFRMALSNDAVRSGRIRLIVPGYQIMNPEDGEVVLPLSQEWVTEITVKPTAAPPPDRQNLALRREIEKLKAEKVAKDADLQRRQAEIDSLKQARTTHMGQASSQIDSLSRLIESAKKESEQLEWQLRELINRRKASFYDELSQTLLNYLDKLKNLSDWMPRVSDAFFSDAGMQQFNQVIGSYNGARDSLFNKHKRFESDISQFWEKDRLLRLEDVHQLVLGEIHRDVVLGVVQNEIVEAMKDFATGKTGRQPALRKAEKSAVKAESLLRVAIPKLEDRMNQLLLTLRD